MGSTPPTHVFDATQKLQDAGAVTASAASTNIIDLQKGAASGAPVGLRRGKIVLDYTALNIDTNDEKYDLVVQLSNSATFGTATGIKDVAQVSIGHNTPKVTDSDRIDGAAGRVNILFENVDEAGTYYRYMRLYYVIAGTGKSITFAGVYHVPLPVGS